MNPSLKVELPLKNVDTPSSNLRYHKRIRFEKNYKIDSKSLSRCPLFSKKVSPIHVCLIVNPAYMYLRKHNECMCPCSLLVLAANFYSTSLALRPHR